MVCHGGWWVGYRSELLRFPTQQTAIICLAMTRGWLPGSLNCLTPVAEGQLQFVPPEGLVRRPRAVLKNSFGFGGTNATLLLRQPAV